MKKESDDFERLKSMIKDTEFAMMTTVSGDGSLHSRPMGNLKVKDFKGTLWFFSKKNSFKNHDLEADQHVNISYANPKRHQYVSVCGKAFFSTDQDKMKTLWDPMLLAWFPEGLADPEISLIGVNVETAEIWDSSVNTVIELVDFFKSKVTGIPLDKKQNNQHLDIRN